MDNQLALEHIHGGVRLFGNKWPEGFSSHGELKIDSLMCRGIQVTRIQGPLWMDSHQLILGTRAEANRTDRPPRQMTANLWGGTSALDGTVHLNDPLTFTLDLSLANGHIDQLAQLGQQPARPDRKGVRHAPFNGIPGRNTHLSRRRTGAADRRRHL